MGFHVEDLRFSINKPVPRDPVSSVPVFFQLQPESLCFDVLIEPSRFDVNQSDEGTAGRIDGKDTVWLARHFGSQEGGPTYDPDYDFNGDGWIDGSELAHLGSEFGECWNGSGWSGSACPQ